MTPVFIFHSKCVLSANGKWPSTGSRQQGSNEAHQTDANPENPQLPFQPASIQDSNESTTVTGFTNTHGRNTEIYHIALHQRTYTDMKTHI